MPAIEVQLRLEYLLLSELAEKFLKDNSKLHDIGKITGSIQRYGFRDPLALDATLNGGTGGIAEGNGRLEALLWMHQQGQEPPTYIKLTEDGDWAVPCVVGGDSDTEDEGIAYSLDHNSLTMAGGTFTALDVSRLYNPSEYQATLEKLAKKKMLPITVDGDDLDLLVEMAKNGGNNPDTPDNGGNNPDTPSNNPDTPDNDNDDDGLGDGGKPERPEYSNAGFRGKFPITIIADEDLHARWVDAQKGCDRNSPEAVLSMILEEAGY